MGKDLPPPSESNSSSPGEKGAVDYGWDIPGVDRQQAYARLGPLDTEKALLDSFKSKMAEALSVLTDPAFAGLSDGGIIAAVRVLQQVANVVESKRVVATRHMQIRERDIEPLSSRPGAKDQTQLLEDLTCLSRRQVKERQLLAARASSHTVGRLRVDAEYPRVETAMAAGLLGSSGAAQIVRALEGAQTTSANRLATAERHMVRVATGTDFDTGIGVSFPLSVEPMRVVCARWEHYLCANGTQPVDAAAESTRFVSLGGKTTHGLIRLRGALLPQNAALLGRLFDAINNPAATPGGDYTNEAMLDEAGKEVRDQRTAAYKRHDAFTRVLDIASRSKDIPLLGVPP